MKRMDEIEDKGNLGLPRAFRGQQERRSEGAGGDGTTPLEWRPTDFDSSGGSRLGSVRL